MSVIQHNMTAINANRYLGINNKKLSKSLEKLSSGYKINRAGDNAAGLAVSEKMRSQIAGMTQGVKNAQDGISMVQTFEGALTETHSILQRMKTLADQMANGSYDDPIDRTAAQQEFLQLNDELDQIADTDFNGVIVLNGGKMADGLKQVGGKFDYANYSREPGKLDSSYINRIDYSKLDDTHTTEGTKANALWKAWNSNWVRTDDNLKNDGPEYIDFTFSYDAASGKWSHESNTAGISVSNDNDIEQKGNGGFTFGKSGVETGAVNVILDETQLMSGDKVTIRINNPSAGITKPGNIGVDATRTTGKLEEGTSAATKIVKDQDANLTTSIAITGTTYTETMNNLVKQVDGATFKATYSSTAANTDEDFSLTLADGTVVDKNSGATVTLKDGTTVTVTKTDLAKGELKLKAGDATNNIEITFSAKAQENDPDTGKTLSSGTITYSLGMEHGSYDNSTLPTAELVGPDGSKVSNSNAFNKSQTILTYKDNIALQVGARTKDIVNFTFKYASTSIGDLKDDLNCTSEGLGTKKLNLNTQEAANYAIDKIDQAINKVSLIRGTFGAIQNRLDHKIDNMNVSIENLTSAESQIRDTNMAEEMMNFTKTQILAQASQSMLAQANQLPQSVLSLLQ